jgi:hypothetical protein
MIRQSGQQVPGLYTGMHVGRKATREVGAAKAAALLSTINKTTIANVMREICPEIAGPGYADMFESYRPFIILQSLKPEFQYGKP